jgi:hypothetical protein
MDLTIKAVRDAAQTSNSTPRKPRKKISSEGRVAMIAFAPSSGTVPSMSGRVRS